VVTRRELLRGVGGGVALASGGTLFGGSAFAKAFDLATPLLPAGTVAEELLEALPGKRALIKKSFRPPNYETPVSYFNEAYTPNDAFFVRYHLSEIPQVDAKTWQLKIGGDAAQTPLTLGLEDLKKFEPVEFAAVCQCSGNRRGLSTPHVAGVEWGYGAMGNAKWKGARLKDVLAKVGLKKEALEVAYHGADGPPMEQTPRFMKSLPVWKALDENVIIAYEMNGAPLPHWNGFPARVIVPGWTATYWMKHVVEMNIISSPAKSFWINTAYRIPLEKFPLIERFTSQEGGGSTPITEMVVNSLITNLKPGEHVKVGRPVTVRGLAWDGGYGIRQVEVSSDGGKTWQDSTLGKDLGRFAWRQWRHSFTPDKPGTYTVMAKATNRAGATQVFELIWNGAGYHNNVVQRIPVHAA
jgi:DMSO/TMAO reductase YedYZ molybdopterin-dependent catalytic subunit